MSSAPITFFCSSCGIKLTVPASLAGVAGPCPSCRNQIQAPSPAPLSPVPLPQSIPAYQPLIGSEVHLAPILPPPLAPVGAPISPPPAATPVYVPPAAVQPAYPPVIAAEPIPATSPTLLRPEPRELPNRATKVEPMAKPMPEAHPTAESVKKAKGRPSHRQARNRLIRLLVFLSFMILVAGVVFGVLTLLMNSKDAPLKQPAIQNEAPKTTAPNNFEMAAEPPAKPSEALPVPAPELPEIVQPPPQLPDGIEPTDPGKEAEEALEKFLTANSLSERLPLIETMTTESELAKSCLAKPLPAASNIFPDFRETNAVEQVIDFYYNVDFDAGDNKLDPQTVLVRKRGGSDPKIVVDPFLDSFGRRLASYAKKPTDKAGIFQVIIYAVASCNDENVPDRDKKLTLKLLPRDNAKEIARAYFGRQSKIGRMLEDGTYDLSFGKAKACTVMLRWNTEDKPQTPFLEALDIKTFDWNPSFP